MLSADNVRQSGCLIASTSFIWLVSVPVVAEIRLHLTSPLKVFCDGFIRVISSSLFELPPHVFFPSLAVSPLIVDIPLIRGCVHLSLIDGHYCLALAHRVCAVCECVCET